MANVLPPESKKQLRRAARARYVFTAGAAAALVALITLIALVPSYLAVHFDAQALAQTPSSSVSASTSLAIVEAQDLITVLTPFLSATTTPAEAISIALSLRPSGVTVNHIDYTRGAGSGQIVLGGSAQSADEIETYRAALANDTHFTSANVPIGSLAGTTGGSFLITLIGPF